MFTRGNLELAPVFLDGKQLGLISSFISIRLRNENLANADKLSAAGRSYLVHSRLQKYLHAMSQYSNQLAASDQSIDQARKEQILRSELSTDVIVGADKTVSVTLTFPSSSRPEQIITVTKSDIDNVRFESSDPVDIATRTAARAEVELLRAWKERQKPALTRGAYRAFSALAGLALVSILLRILQRRLRRSDQKLTHLLLIERQASMPVSNPLPSAGEGESDLHHVKSPLRGLTLRQQSSVLRLYRILLYWLHWLLWILGVAYISSLFFFSRPFSNWLLGVSILGQNPEQPFLGFPPRDWIVSLGREATIGAPLLILLLLLCTSVAVRAGNLMVDTFMRKWARAQVEQRLQLRSTSIANALKGWLRAGVYFLLALMILSQLHSLGAFTRGVTIFAGFLSFALSLASQNLLKDLISGLLILWEDQYAAGDVISIGEHGGLVENVGLRVTKLRNLDGELITVPNGSVNVVRNLSSDWSQVNYAVDLDYHVDVNRVLEVMASVADDLYRDPDWSQRILKEPEILGIDNISHTGITIRMIIKTLPLEQWAAGREYRRRLKMALDEAGIEVGVPRLELRRPPS